jgi:hypothetical protein
MFRCHNQGFKVQRPGLSSVKLKVKAAEATSTTYSSQQFGILKKQFSSSLLTAGWPEVVVVISTVFHFSGAY